MLDPATFVPRPKQLTHKAVVSAVIDWLAWRRFGRRSTTLPALHALYRRSFDLELAICPDFCCAPAGWVERHEVRLPAAFEAIKEQQIRVRLERMLHAPRSSEAIDAILATASYVIGRTGGKTAKRHRLIHEPRTLAKSLVRARAQDPGFADALIHGDLHLCLDNIAEKQRRGSPIDLAVQLLTMMARLWGLHDLQIIAARLHQSIYQPTGGFVEGIDAGPQSFQAWAVDPKKMAEMAEIAYRLQRQRPGDETLTTRHEKKRFWGFVTGTPFKSLAREFGLECGLRPEDLDRIDGGEFTGKRELESMLRSLSFKASLFKPAITEDLSRYWDDRAPVRPGEKPKSVKHLSASTVRYGIDAPAALAHAIIAFIDLSEQLPTRI